MIKKTPLILVLFIAFTFCIEGCKRVQDSKDVNKGVKIESKLEDTTKVNSKLENPIPSNFKSPLRPNETLELGKVYIDTLTFMNFHDHLDYFRFEVAKNKESIYLIPENKTTKRHLSGATILIHWKMDSIRYVGDPETLSFKEFLVSSKDIPSELKSTLRPNETLELGKVYTDTVNYVDFNDDYDFWYFVLEKNRDTITFIYNNEENTKFVRGDELVVNWKMDSLRNAGDPEFLHYSEFLVSSKKIKLFELTDKNVKALWRESQYDETLEAEVNTLVLSKEYINTISAAEKAALAYVATFIGNECEWDGKVNDSRSNLKCKILTALDLGYQCSDTHYGFLKKWFSKDVKVLKTLETCRTIPNTATKQSTFDEISIQTNARNQTITIRYKVIISNMRESSVSRFTKTDTFQYKSGNLTLLNSEKTGIQSADETKNTFVISCGSGCAMTYTEHKIISNVDTSQVTFKVTQHINEVQDNEYFETYVFKCDTENQEVKIQLKESENNKSKEDLHPEIQKHLEPYARKFCNRPKN